VNSKLKIITVNIIVIIIAIEVVLRLFGQYTTYSEKRGNGYESYYGQKKDSWLWIWTPEKDFVLDHKEFRFNYKINSLGVREKEFPLKKKDSVKRIITIGDSFTEGVGVPYDSSWPRIFEKGLEADYPARFEVLNAGVSGSDPFYYFKFYEQVLYKYKPDLLVVSMGNSEMTDYAYRGGFERFKADSTTQFRKAPWFEGIYKFSYIARFVVHVACGYNETLMTKAQLEEIKTNGLRDITGCINKLDDLCKANSCKLVVVLFPHPDECVPGYEKSDYKNYFSVFPVAGIVDTSKVCLVNINDCIFSTVTPANIDAYRWQMDRHYNAAGYQIYAKCVRDELDKNYPGLLSK
jgi:lysophospholipase L1-like esterase